MKGKGRKKGTIWKHVSSISGIFCMACKVYENGGWITFTIKKLKNLRSPCAPVRTSAESSK